MGNFLIIFDCFLAMSMLVDSKMFLGHDFQILAVFLEKLSLAAIVLEHCLIVVGVKVLSEARVVSSFFSTFIYTNKFFLYERQKFL